MNSLKIALISREAVEYTTANYFRDIFTDMGISFRKFAPSEQRRIPREFNVRFYVDDGTHYVIHLAEGIMKVLYLIDTHTSLPEDLVMSRMADLVFCAQKEAADEIAKSHPAVFWLPLACDPVLHYKEVFEKQFDLAFIGGVADPRRERMLRILGERYPNSFIGRAPRERIGEIYSSSRIVVNIAVKDDLNMRFFEGLCSGSLLMTDSIVNSGMDALLREDDRPFCTLYRDLDDLLQKIDYYLDHDAERELIAVRGREFSAAHTYRHRWESIERHIAAAFLRSLNHYDLLAYWLLLLKLRLGAALKRRFSHGQ